MRQRVQKFFNKPSRTKQEFKQECDLDLMIKRFGRTPEGRQALADAGSFAANLRFEDVSSIPDFRAACDLVIAAEERFGALPAHLRKRFDNSPEAFVHFCQDEKNLAEMRQLGLLKPEASKEPVLPPPSKDGELS